MIHLILIVHGLVQNVGFRYNVKLFADKIGIKGYIRNLRHQSVEIYFIGDNEALKKLIYFINSNPGNSSIKNIENQQVDNKKKFEFFKILY